MVNYRDILRKQIVERRQGACDTAQVRPEDIAVIGMAARFPGAPDIGTFWKLLVEGREGITEIPRARWDWRDYYDKDADAPDKAYNRWGGFLEDIDQFDPFFFNISPKEALLMDPQQRLFLEVAWRTLEHAGYAGDALAGSETGVFAGCTNSHYSRQYDLVEEQEDHYISTVGNWNAVLPNRVSYFFDFRGPSVLVDTLCSSSLVALHLACQSLRSQECGAALVGGANLILSPEHYIAGSKLKAHSPDGRCKAFDHRANGFTSGEGVAALLLKPLNKAIEDRDTIYGLVKGSAVNHDGRTNGIMAPNPGSQSRVIERALRDANVSADSIGYVECHGTGTRLGDPIEIEGLSRAFRKQTDRNQCCAIGSVKTNIGHLEAAAGAAGLVKTILSLYNTQIPPSINYERQNSHISFEETPFYVNTELKHWTSREPRRAGVSSFGLSGVNAHVILQEAPAIDQVPQLDRSAYLLVVSARTKSALGTLLLRYRDYIKVNSNVSLGDLCWTASVGAGNYKYRVAIVAESKPDLITKLGSISESPQQQCENFRNVYYGETGITTVSQIETSLSELDRCAERYVQGEGVDWPLLYEGECFKHVPLPAYPFETKRYWPEGEEGSSVSAQIESDTLRRLPCPHPLLGQQNNSIHADTG
ncbi:MAG: hypothetical protein GXP23_10320 [Gammaproteobacteria bacterium]|nr:hypothetical protein [Gammaproteobacteria bacterium]